MRTIDHEEVTFESIDDHIDRFDCPGELPFTLNPANPTASRQRLTAVSSDPAPDDPIPLIPKKWQAPMDLLVLALDGVVGGSRQEGGREANCRLAEKIECLEWHTSVGN